MKLVFCPLCRDVFRLWFEPHNCRCGSSGGRYLDQTMAEMWGRAVPMIFTNDQVNKAVHEQADRVFDSTFTVDVPPRDHPRIVWVEKPD